MKTDDDGARSRAITRFIAGAIWACGVVCAGGVGVAAATGPSSHAVAIDGVSFKPEALTVQRGDTVVWVNKDPFPHTVTASGSFDSHSIAAGASWKFVARKAGDYSYICTLHPNMNGTLRVE